MCFLAVLHYYFYIDAHILEQEHLYNFINILLKSIHIVMRLFDGIKATPSFSCCAGKYWVTVCNCQNRNSPEIIR